MRKILSLTIGWVWMIGCSLAPLSAVPWAEQHGIYLSQSSDQLASRHLYDWQAAKAELKFRDLNEGNIPSDAGHHARLLPPAVVAQLTRLGIMARNGNEWRLCQKLSLTFVLHQPLRQESFAASERLWYRNDTCPGEAAVLLIPLSPGRISWSIPADFSTGSLRVASMPNSFFKRIFPFGYRDAPDWYLTRISGANDREPFAFVSLVLCPRQRHVFVAIEIIPPSGTALNNIQAVENLLQRFIDSCHPIWQNRSVTVMERAPEPPPAPAQPRGTGPQPPQPRQAAQQSSPPERSEPEPDDFWEDPQERPFPEPRPNPNTWREPEGCPPQHETDRHERWWRQRNEWHRQWEIWFAQQQRRWERRRQRWESRERRRCTSIRARQERVIRYVEHSEQEALANFAHSAESSAPPVEARWAPPPPTMPELSEDILADVLADVLTEDIELNGDALLEEILEEEEEEPEPPEEPDIPPQPTQEMYLLPKPTHDGQPPLPNYDPNEALRPELHGEMNQLAERYGHLCREYNELYGILRPFATQNERRSLGRNRVGLRMGGEEWYEWIFCNFLLPRDNYAQGWFDRSNQIINEQNAIREQALGLWKRNVDMYNQEVDRHRQWVEQFNRKVDEYNAVSRSEQERVEREKREWQEKILREQERYKREFAEYRQAYDTFHLARFANEPQRSERAKRVLEDRCIDLLDKAQYQVSQASMFPLPSARPARQGGRPRSDSPPPLNDAWIRRAEAKLRIGDHNNTIRTSVRRMLRDGCGLSQRTAQNLGDSAEYAVDAAVAYFLGGLSKVGKAAGFAGSVIKAAARKAVGKIEVKLREPPPAEGPRVPGEGEVGAYRELPPRGEAARHHLPNAEYMRQHGVSRREGVSMYVQQQFGARGGRHIDIHRQPQFQRIPNETPPRDALSQSVRRVREIYQQDRAYTSDIRRGLREVIRQNKERFPRLFRRD